MTDNIIEKIANAVKQFNTADFYKTSQELFVLLGFALEGDWQFYELDDFFSSIDFNTATFSKNYQKILTKQQKVSILGVINTESLQENTKNVFSIEDLKNNKYHDGLGVLLCDLEYEPNKSDLMALVRMFNIGYYRNPIILLFRYQKQGIYFISIGTSLREERQRNAKFGGEVVGKVSIIKDINVTEPHRGHLNILNDLRAFEDEDSLFPKKIRSFDKLYQKWYDVFNLKTLSKAFYNEIANWFFWAVTEVKFPIVENKNQEQCNQIAVIRLLTRLFFVWFLKEKGLITKKVEKDQPRQDFFNENDLQNILLDFEKASDKDIFTPKDTFYKAILQNLFFATLNRPYKERDFATKKTFHENRAENFDVNSLYRYEALFRETDLEKIKAIFEHIPFLNGGLFDCLDKKSEDKKSEKNYFDGFTRSPKKQPKVPDFLFFRKKNKKEALQIEPNAQINAVLNKAYETKNKKYPFVQGIINILKSYKFTVEENTPLEIEVALDPELLGKIFESLLAYHNPETTNSFRKATGSFYTPIEMVDYMVQESLLIYLKNKIVDFHQKNRWLQSMPSFQTNFLEKQAIQGSFADTPNKLDIKDLEKKLQVLLSNAALENPFDKTQTQLLVEAIYSIKIFDPACGSGAFPMGLLNKLIFVLNKLDKENHFAKTILTSFKEDEKQQQIEQLAKEHLPKRKELEENRNLALQMTIRELREKNVEQINQMLDDIDKAFEEAKNKIEDAFKPQKYQLDYGKKLYLIQNCIFGVDIQQIAVQISKLRFFLSLTIDQKNEHIQPLPNLETKFVCANTLLALSQTGQLGITDKRLPDLEKELQENRIQYFTVKNRTDKEKLQKKDKKIREKIAKILENSGFEAETAQKMADFDIFDQNGQANWFDIRWMFGIKDGFDIVIGNPPYIQLQKMKKQQEELKKQNFLTYTKMGDMYALFYEKSVQLLQKNGILAYITSNKWLRAAYGEKLREFFLQHNPIQLIDFGGFQVFESATVDTNILLLQKANNSQQLHACRIEKEFEKGHSLSQYFQNKKILLQNLTKDSWNIADNATQALKTKIEQKGIPLKEWDIQINYGITTGFNEAFVIDKVKKDQLIAQDPKSAEIIKPLLRGRDIKRYKVEFADLYLICTFPALKIDIEQYPAIKNHLLSFGKRLHQTGEIFLENGISVKTRKKTGNKWFETQDQIAYYQDFEKEKIAYPNMTKYIPFIFDDLGHLINDKGFILTSNSVNLKFLLGYFNSKISHRWIQENCPELQGGTREVRKIYFENIPIPKVSADLEKVFEELVDKILALKKAGKPTHSLENQIDELVFGLYGLSESERALVLG